MTTKTKSTGTLEPTAKIVNLKKPNVIEQFREGTAVRKRVTAVLTAKTVQQAISKGARTSTIRFLARQRAIKIAA